MASKMVVLMDLKLVEVKVDHWVCRSAVGKAES